MSSTESRLASVERQLRFHRAVIAALLIALVALVGYGATEGVPDVIQARKFAVVDDGGKEVVKIKSWEMGGMILIYSSEEKDQTAITLGHTVPGSAAIRFLGKEGHSNFTAGVSKTLGGYHTLKNKDGKDIIYAGAVGPGHGLLVVGNKDGVDVIYAGTDTEGHGRLTVRNKDGKDIIYAGASGTTKGMVQEGDGILGVFDKNGNPRQMIPQP